jgi:hypothetical protein
MLGARRLIRLMNLRPFTTIVSLNNALVRSDVRRRKWLLPPLVRTSMPEPVKRNLLDVALWVFSFNLPDFFGLRGIAKFAPFRKLTSGLKYTRGLSTFLGLSKLWDSLRS